MQPVFLYFSKFRVNVVAAGTFTFPWRRIHSFLAAVPLPPNFWHSKTISILQHDNVDDMNRYYTFTFFLPSIIFMEVAVVIHTKRNFSQIGFFLWSKLLPSAFCLDFFVIALLPLRPMGPFARHYES